MKRLIRDTLVWNIRNEHFLTETADEVELLASRRIRKRCDVEVMLLARAEEEAQKCSVEYAIKSQRAEPPGA
jgi:hypothetical protein